MSILEITAGVWSDIDINRVELFVSPAEDVPFGNPFLMQFANYTPATMIYNYTHRLEWVNTSIHLQIMVEDTNGVRSEPRVVTVSWSSWTNIQILLPAGAGGWAFAAAAAAGSLGAAVILRRLLLSRAK